MGKKKLKKRLRELEALYDSRINNKQDQINMLQTQIDVMQKDMATQLHYREGVVYQPGTVGYMMDSLAAVHERLDKCFADQETLSNFVVGELTHIHGTLRDVPATDEDDTSFELAMKAASQSAQSIQQMQDPYKVAEEQQ